MIAIENKQIIYLKTRHDEITKKDCNYWNKPYNPASYVANLQGECGNLRYFHNNCEYRNAKGKHQILTFSPSSIILIKQLSFLPEQPGVYALFSEERECIYVGSSKNIKKRAPAHSRFGMLNKAAYIAYWLAEQKELHSLESLLIASLHPAKNIQGRNCMLPKWCNPQKRWRKNLWPPTSANENISAHYHAIVIELLKKISTKGH